MSASSISSSFLSYNNLTTQNSKQQFQQEFQQLGKDLQSGNLSAAQQDFVTLQQSAPQGNSTSSTQTSSSLAGAFKQLAQDLQSGNLSGAQQDYTKIQQDYQSQSVQGQTTHGHHRHHYVGGSNEISQLVDQLGQALQSGNLSSAQQLYSTLEQNVQQSGQASGESTAPSSRTISNGVSVSA
jgi:outer membrane protein assembly factor BamD (BamD/ComL family)